MFKNTNYFSWKCPNCGFIHEYYPDPAQSNIGCADCGTEFNEVEWIETENFDEPVSASDLIGMFFVKGLCISMLFYIAYQVPQL